MRLATRSRTLLSPIALLAIFTPALLTATLSSSSANAQIRTAPPPMFGNRSVATQFAPDPAVFRGISGGDLAAESVAGRLETETGPCLGYVSEKPDHRIQLTSFFSYLNLEITAGVDTTLIVKGPGGTWCSDNVSRQNPSISGQWMPGVYEVWVGSNSPDAFGKYQLTLTEVR
jgi:hypothetical protein